MPKCILTVSAAMLLAAGCFVIGGCNRVTPASVRRDMSPEKDTLTRSKQEHANDIARTLDTNLRQVGDDLDYIFLLDRPMRGSRHPVP